MTSSLLQHAADDRQRHQQSRTAAQVTWTPGALPEIRDNQKFVVSICERRLGVRRFRGERAKRLGMPTPTAKFALGVNHFCIFTGVGGYCLPHDLDGKLVGAP
jgi:hypothetical protein